MSLGKKKEVPDAIKRLFFLLNCFDSIPNSNST